MSGKRTQGVDTRGIRMAREGNQRMAGLAQSEIRAMTSACARVKGINMAQGVCDTPTPSLVIEAAERAMRQGINTYTRYDGLAELRQASRASSPSTTA